MALYNRLFKSKLGSRLIRATVINIFIVIFLLLAGMYQFSSIIKGFTAKQQHLNIIGDQVQILMQSLIDQETGQRGYTLTRKKEFLEPFHNGTKTFTTTAYTLKGLTSNYPIINKKLKVMIAKGNDWHENYGQPQVEAVMYGHDVTSSNFEAGKYAFDSLRSSYKTVHQTVSQEINQNDHEFWQRLMGSIMVLCTIIIACILWTGRRIYVSMKRIVGPIVDLEDCIKSYTTHNFYANVPAYPIKDELGMLIKGVDFMRRALAERFEEMGGLANTDSLTGLSNRRAFVEQYKVLEQNFIENQTPFSIAFLDIDNFKNFNDRYGHLEGDRVLIHVAKVMKKTVGNAGSAFRFGGEEFVVLVQETKVDDAKVMAERIRISIENTPLFPYSITGSFGVASVMKDDQMEDVLKRADEALYKAKLYGKNRVEVHG